MQEIRGEFIERIKRTASVESFRFKPEDKIDFLPGQFLEVIFAEEDRNNRSLNKFLSFSCSPGKGYIEVTKRISNSDFSKALLGLKEGDSVLFKAPLGSCVFKEEYSKIGFLIGGIGITPVISILEYIFDKGLATDVNLLYSNRSEEDIAFKKELDFWAKACKKVKVIYTVSDSQPKNKNFFFGRINKNLLVRSIPDYRERIFFIFGPPKMVEVMSKLCFDLGCLKERIKIENFVGY